MNPEPAPVPYPWQEAPPPPPSRRPLGRGLGTAALVVVALAVLGAPLGLLWHTLAPAVPVVNTGTAIVVNDASPEEYIAADGTFTLLGAGFGVLAAIAVWLLMRRDRGPLLLIGVVLGSLAAPVVAWQAGRLVGLAAFQEWQRTSAAGDGFAAPPDLHAYGPLLVPAFAAVIVTTLLAGWSNDPDLDRPGATPGSAHRPVSSGWPDGPDPTAEPAPPAPSPADRPPG